MRKQVAYVERLFKLVTHLALDGNCISPRNFILFLYFLKRIFVSFSGDLSDCAKVFHSSPRPFCVPFFSILLLIVSFWWICRYGGYDGKHASHILLSQRLDPNEKQVIDLDQDVQVCGYFWWMMEELLHMISLSL